MAVLANLFDTALEFIRVVEGGLSSRPPADDPGGRTNLGITERTLALYRTSYREDGDMPLSVRELTFGQASRIYRKLYWDVCRCDELPPPIALAVFNAAVQSGPVRAVRWLQQAIGTTVDGVIGPNTLSYVKFADPAETLFYYFANQIVSESLLHNWEANRRGWARRLFRLCWLASQHAENAEVQT